MNSASHDPVKRQIKDYYEHQFRMHLLELSPQIGRHLSIRPEQVPRTIRGPKFTLDADAYTTVIIADDRRTCEVSLSCGFLILTTRIMSLFIRRVSFEADNIPTEPAPSTFEEDLRLARELFDSFYAGDLGRLFRLDAPLPTKKKAMHHACIEQAEKFILACQSSDFIIKAIDAAGGKVQRETVLHFLNQASVQDQSAANDIQDELRRLKDCSQLAPLLDSLAAYWVAIEMTINSSPDEAFPPHTAIAIVTAAWRIISHYTPSRGITTDEWNIHAWRLVMLAGAARLNWPRDQLVVAQAFNQLADAFLDALDDDLS